MAHIARGFVPFAIYPVIVATAAQILLTVEDAAKVVEVSDEIAEFVKISDELVGTSLVSVWLLEADVD